MGDPRDLGLLPLKIEEFFLQQSMKTQNSFILTLIAIQITVSQKLELTKWDFLICTDTSNHRYFATKKRYRSEIHGKVKDSVFYPPFLFWGRLRMEQIENNLAHILHRSIYVQKIKLYLKMFIQVEKYFCAFSPIFILASENFFGNEKTAQL